MPDKISDEDAIRAVANFLTQPTYGYSGERLSPLEQVVRVRVAKMASEIAADVIESMPELSSKIRTMVTTTVATILANDEYLNAEVVKAVSHAMAQVRDERNEEE